VGGDTGEWDPSGRCSHFLFGSPPRSAWKTSSANFVTAKFAVTFVYRNVCRNAWETGVL
jgi:hypothetical protein